MAAQRGTALGMPVVPEVKRRVVSSYMFSGASRSGSSGPKGAVKSS